MYCKHCGKKIDDDSTFCRHCGHPINQGAQQINSEEQVSQETVQVDSIESSTINDGEKQHAEDNKQSENNRKPQPPKKGSSCLTIILIAALVLFANFFIRPMAKLYMRQRMKHQTEASGVLGAGLDRAEPIMNKLRKETPSNLGFLGKLEKVYYGIGTISMEFKKPDYDNSPSGNAAKKYVIAEIQAMPNSLKKVIREIVEEDFYLNIEIISEDTRDKIVVVNLSPSEIEKVLNE